MKHVKSSVLKVLSLSFVLGSISALSATAAENAAFDVRPTPVKTPPPEYPANLRRDGVSGVVAVKVEIDESGIVTNCSVSKSSNPGFEQAAVNAVKGWKFTPAKKDGAPVKISLVIPIKFSLDES
ncbi:MAG: energy transducer TonB [Nibricoccus sp.]